MPRYVKSFYENSERQKIVDHIIEKNLYFELRGRTVWQEMEELQICPGRTWQSMKQHFHTNMINTLHTLNINEQEKKRILDCYYKRYLYSPNKRKRVTSGSSTEGEKQEKTFKKTKAKSSDVGNVIEKSPKLINPCSRKFTSEHDNKVNTEDTQISVNKEIEPNNLSFMDGDNEQDLDSSLLEPYSDQEDKNIIIYINENMNWTDLEYFDDIYEDCHKNVLLKRSGASIKKRFLNVILPNLYKYNILNVDEIPLFYDRAGVDIPPELDQILSDFMENNSNYSGETMDSNNSSLNHNECSLNKNILKNYNVVLNNIKENKIINSQKNTDDATKENEEETNLEKTFSDVCLNNMVQNQNTSLNIDKESYILNNVNRSCCSTSKTSPKNDTIKGDKNEGKYEYRENKKNSHDSQETVTNKIQNIERIDVCVQANVVDSKFMAQFVANQLCLNINNEEHVFISESKNNKHDIMNELKVHHNIINDNIHIITQKSYNDLQRIKTLDEILERKILNLKDKNVTNPIEVKLLPLNFNMIESLRLICPCAWNMFQKPIVAQVPPVIKRQSRVVHLPVNLQHLKDNKYLEKICQCCTGVQPCKRKKSKKRKKNQKTNILKANNNNAPFPTENKTKDVEDNNCSADQLHKEYFIGNSDIPTELEINNFSDHSSPIISMSRRNKIKFVDVNRLLSKEMELPSTGNIVDKTDISSINPEILSLNYSPTNSANSMKLDNEKISDTAVLENSPKLNNHLNDPLSISTLPSLNDLEQEVIEEIMSDCELDDSREISVLPSTLFVRQNEELYSNNEMENENTSASPGQLNEKVTEMFNFSIRSHEIDAMGDITLVLSSESDEDENNVETRNKNTVCSITCDESNKNIYSDHERNNRHSDSSMFSVRSDEHINSGLEIEMKEGIDNCSFVHSNKLNVEEHNSKREIIPCVILNESNKNFSSCGETLSYQSLNLFKAKIQQTNLGNCSEEVHLPQLNENSSENEDKKIIDVQVKIDDSNLNYAPTLEDEVNSNSRTNCFANDGNMCNNIVLQKTKITYEQKYFVCKRYKKLHDEENIESINFMREVSSSADKIVMESLNKEYMVNIDLNGDTCLSDITLPLNYEENCSLDLNSLNLLEIRLSSNIEVRKNSVWSDPGISKDVQDRQIEEKASC